ncbi:uncharacterized protein LOC129953606, partial [Eupeodes corollae]|uniref:uncharacterized protein LOC129953606 n=1 Tax=Eupeodes corollae TaxID=290404 RepID=UPI00249037DC
MNAIKVKRGYAKGTLTRAAQFAESLPVDITLAELEIRLERLHQAWLDFLSLNHELCEFCDDANFVDPGLEFEEYEEKYLKTHSIFTNQIRQFNSQNNSADDSIIEKLADQQTSFLKTLNSATQKSSVKLPTANIPIFDGKYEDWPEFKDLFLSSVDRNTNLSGAQKFQYLKSFLRGGASGLLKHMRCSEENYVEAWDRLEARYEKKNLIVQAFVESFLSLPSSNSENIQVLRKITDGADEVIRGLNALKSNNRDPWLIYLLLQKVDPDTRQAWADNLGAQEDATIDQFLTFLQTRCSNLEACTSLTTTRKKTITPVRSHLVESTQNCPKCHGGHILPQCTDFISLDVVSRREFVKKHSICFNCLRQGHGSYKCRSNFRCKTCKARHHSLVHPTNNPATEHSSSNDLQRNNTTSLPNPPIVSNHSLESSRPSHTILPTAIVKIQDSQGFFQTIRLLLDTGSQVSFITEHAVQRLGLKRKRSRIPISGIASTSAGVTNGLVTANLHSRFNSSFVEVDCFIISKLTSVLPSCSIVNIDSSRLSFDLADPTFKEPGEIDILIGADKVFSIITGPAIPAEHQVPERIPTIFGWVVVGQFNQNTSGLVTFCTQLDFSQDFDLERFWRLEEVSNVPVLSLEEQQAEDSFVNTHIRHSDGKFMVELPFKTNQRTFFGNSFSIAFNRLQSIERKFASNPDLKSQYSKFMNEYLELGHMKEVPPNEIAVDNNRCYYLPHHAVFKSDSSTTKIRVVFDGSAKSYSSMSLNECLLVGPTIQRDIFSICLRFRRHKYTISGDIEKMYRQIWVSPKHSDFQRILWRESPEGPVKHYRLLTVTYGTTSAPFLAVRSLQQVALESALSHPVASSIILNDFYVDDVMTGADSIDEVIKLQADLVELLKSAGFHLRKWTTNCWPLLLSIPEEQRELSPVDFEESSSVKLLGLQWCPSRDCFSYKVRLDTSKTVTKRRILSEASRIFDPIGFLAPVVVGVKIIMQNLWKEKLSWDEVVPEHLVDRWTLIHQDLHQLENLSIPRVMWSDKNNYELHGFCDASLDAYAAVVYCRSVNPDESVSVSLVAAKTKVAPIKILSLPRLELCGALLLTRLINKIQISLQEKESKIFAWTDSSIVLHWLSAVPKRWSVFIGNRTSEVLSSLPRKMWNHVRSASNPADIASRGISPSHLCSNEMWWKGPHWLSLDRHFWPTSPPVPEEFSKEELEERKLPGGKTKVFVSYLETDNIMDPVIVDTLIKNVSNWNKIIRVVAYVRRFLRNYVRDKKYRTVGPLSTKELLHAKIVIIKKAQYSLFSFEIGLLKRNKPLSKRNKLVSLSPFLDAFGVLRVGGRIQQSTLSYDQKHPVILCKTHPISTLIVTYKHNQYLHSGVTLTFSLIKANFYILGCRNLIRKIVHKCIVCFRQRVTTSQQLMGNLPIDRVIYSRPFSKVGCDYAGPITLRSSRLRNAKLVKSYIALFVCFVTKGIHLELVGDLSTNAFLLALDRFVARRGKPSEIWSDNGTNFHGAKRTLDEMYNQLRSQHHNTIVADHLSKDGISWKFIPPAAPHFGGLWEAGVKSVKTHIKRVIGENKLTYEEMYTLLAKIEALLNSRPMWHVSDSEPTALSPSHFMIGEQYVAIPQSNISNNCIKTN